MLAKALAPAVLLVASAVHAQNTPSVVTFISISPVPTTEQVFTVQTSVPSRSTTPCYEVCIMEPCPPCGQTSVDGSMGIPPGETPIIDSSVISQSIFTNPLRTTPVPTIPVSPSVAPSVAPSVSPSVSPSRSGGSAGTSSQPSRSGTAPPQQSTAAASSLNLNSNQYPVAMAMVGAAFALL